MNRWERWNQPSFYFHLTSIILFYISNLSFAFKFMRSLNKNRKYCSSRANVDILNSKYILKTGFISSRCCRLCLIWWTNLLFWLSADVKFCTFQSFFHERKLFLNGQGPGSFSAMVWRRHWQHKEGKWIPMGVCLALDAALPTSRQTLPISSGPPLISHVFISD